ncbi:MAG: hypothetical protein KJP00_13415 [Bacteroidia bacterium]|nr:hypothetical protein [Bacteroidia bacterium]
MNETSFIKTTKRTIVYPRRAIGYIAFLMPFVLTFGTKIIGVCDTIQSSISAYYHTDMRWVLLGSMIAIALLLVSYKGYNKADEYTTNIAAFLAVGIIIFPSEVAFFPECTITTEPPQIYEYKLHNAFAGFFFLALAYMSYFIFTRSSLHPQFRKKAKVYRNRVYRICAITILACMILIIVYKLFLEEIVFITKIKPIFWLESIAMLAFGTSWLTKGQVLFRDVKLKDLDELS